MSRGRGIAVEAISGPGHLASPILRGRAERAARSNARQFAATIHDEEAGYLSFEDRPDLALGVIYEVFVLSKFRCRGVGSALIRFGEDLARQAVIGASGCTRVRATMESVRFGWSLAKSGADTNCARLAVARWRKSLGGQKGRPRNTMLQRTWASRCSAHAAEHGRRRAWKTEIGPDCLTPALETISRSSARESASQRGLVVGSAGGVGRSRHRGRSDGLAARRLCGCCSTRWRTCRNPPLGPIAALIQGMGPTGPSLYR